MAAKDYYDILGVPRNASKEEIKRAYKRLAKKHHPDLNNDPGAEEKFKEINEAASVLGDDRKRAQYDRFGTTAEGFGAGAGGFDFRDFSSFADFGFDFGEIFDRFFSGFGGLREEGYRRRPSRGADLRFDLEITLEEAATETKKTIIIPRLEVCSKCRGSGAESKSDIITCNECHGTGYAKKTRRMPFGVFTTATTCGKCRGQGKYIKKNCPLCDGEGRVEKTRKIEVNIPAGVDTGSRLRIAGEGEVGERGAKAGDLYVVIRVRPHKTFERDGNDIYTEVNVPFVTAALGGEVEVPTLIGKAKLNIPAGTQSNTLFRMRGKGIPDLETGKAGDENIKVVIEVPKKLTKRQKELLKEFAKQEQKSILSKIF
jgi:molecular chaperone DnaJ